MTLIALVDSNQLERQTLKQYVEHTLDEAHTAYMIHEFDGGVEFIRSRAAYDIVLMETQLEDMSGLDAARFLRIVNEDAKLIFVTHMAQLAICGYEMSALDFLVKPVTQPVVEGVIKRALKCIEKDNGSYYALKTPGGIISLPTRSIYYVEIYDHNLVYHTEQGDHKIRGRLGEVREKLGDRLFIQCNRSYLVNMRHVQSLHGDHLVVNNVKIQIAKSHYKEIEQIFMNYLSGQA